MKVFMKRLGNKERHKNKILPYFPISYNKYIEPFVGSGSILLYLEPKVAIINDINLDVYDLWMCVKNYPKEFIKHLKALYNIYNAKSIDEYRNYLLKISTKLYNMERNCKRVSVYVMMIYSIYMGIFLKNTSYGFSILDLNLYNGKIPFCFQNKYYNNIDTVSQYLNNNKIEIHNKDYKVILKKAKTGDFVFLDPPYIENHDYQFNYNKDENVDNVFLEELNKEIKVLDRKGVKWLMTQADTPYVRKMFNEYNIIEYNVYRYARKAYTTELIIRNY